MKFTFKFKQKIKEAWSIYKANLGLFFLMFALMFIEQVFASKDSLILWAISVIISLFVGYMIIRFLLSLVDKKEFNPFSKVSLPSMLNLWNFLKTYLLFIIITSGGAFIFLIPVMFFVLTTGMITPLMLGLLIASIVCLIVGMYFAIRLAFSLFISVDKNKGAVKSIKESWKMTKGNFWNIFGKMLVIGLFAISGFIGLIVGILITYPMAMILMAMLYRDLQKIKEGGVISKIEDKIEKIEEEMKEKAEELEESLEGKASEVKDVIEEKVKEIKEVIK